MPPKKGTRQARGLARQDQILDVAFELFAERGVRATTVAEIAAQAGLSEPGLLHHFPSKDALLMAVLARADASFTDEEAYVAEPGGGMESLRRMPATARIFAERPMHARLRAIVTAESILEDGAARSYVVARTEWIRTLITKSLAKGIRDKEIRRDVDPARVATEIIAFMEGIQVQWMLAPDQVDILKSYESYVDALVEQLSPKR